jgi:hypothetical protein
MEEKELIIYIIKNIKDIIANEYINNETLTKDEIKVLDVYKNKIVVSFLNYFNGKSSFFIDIGDYKNVELLKKIFKCIDMIIDNIDLVTFEELNKLLKDKKDLNLMKRYENLFLKIVKSDLKDELKKNLLLLLTDDEKSWHKLSIQIKDKDEYDEILKIIYIPSNDLAKRLKSRITIFNSTNILKTLNDKTNKYYYFYKNYCKVIRNHTDSKYPNVYLIFFKHFYYGYNFDNFCKDIEDDIDLLIVLDKINIMLYLQGMVDHLYNTKKKELTILIKSFEEPLERFTTEQYKDDITNIIFNDKEIKDHEIHDTLNILECCLLNIAENKTFNIYYKYYLKNKFLNKITNDLLPKFKSIIRQKELIAEEKRDCKDILKPTRPIPLIPIAPIVSEVLIPTLPIVSSSENNEKKYKLIDELFVNYHFNDSDIENIKIELSNYESYTMKDINYVKKIIIFYFLFKYLLLIIGEITFDLRNDGILYIDGGLSIILNNKKNVNLVYKTYDIDLKYIPSKEDISVKDQIEIIKNKFYKYSENFSNECKKINIDDIELLKHIEDEKATPIINDIINSIKNSIEFNIVGEEDIDRGIIKYGIQYKYKTIRDIIIETPVFNMIDISVCNKELNSYKLFIEITKEKKIFYKQIPTDNFIINFVSIDYLKQKIELLSSDKIADYIDTVPDIPIEKTIEFIRNKILNQSFALNNLSDGKKKRSLRKLKKSLKRKSVKRSFRKLKKSFKRKSFKRKSFKRKSLKRKSLKRKVKILN